LMFAAHYTNTNNSNIRIANFCGPCHTSDQL